MTSLYVTPNVEETLVVEENHVNRTVSDNDATVPSKTTASLEALQTTEQRELMDLVDRLRRAGLSSVLQLPQIVVCGDQSSGKSSVLEAITEIPFPRKENLCTRFATEISMRRDSESSISCKINPDDGRDEGEKDKLRTFSKSIEDFKELPSLIDEATALMGLGPQKAFSKDVLHIEICGPHRPQLTLVDLPGLIHSSNKSQSEEDVELIKSLIEEYISEKRTIILAIVSAKNDYANQIILKNCREFDPDGARTLGVITKPDYLRPDSENEAQWLELARNEDIKFQLGWHILKNRTDSEHHLSFQDRNTREHNFFKSGNYKALPRHIKGIDTLRERLSTLLFDHLKQELPSLKEELDKTARATCLQLKALGGSRASLLEQRVYLAELSSTACSILHMGFVGAYDTDFFGSIDPEAAIDEGQNALRLRAVVQYLNVQFAEKMRKCGHTYNIKKESDGVSIDEAPPSERSGKTEIKKSSTNRIEMTRPEAIQWVTRTLERSRGRELPGTFNPMLIGYLFQEQSERWEALARSHINLVASACKKFVGHVLNHVAVPEVKTKLEDLTVLPVLRRAHDAAINELTLIMKDKKVHPITYNHYFTDTLQKIQQDRHAHRIASLTKAATVSVKEQVPGDRHNFSINYVERNYIEPKTFVEGLKGLTERDMDKFSAEQALDAHDAYYKDEQKYFIGVVTKQAIERHLLSQLTDIISPKVMAQYNDSEIKFVAAEPPETAQLRMDLENKKKMLQNGQDEFQATMGHDI